MIIRLEENHAQPEIEVHVRFPEMNSTVRRLEAVIRSVDTTVSCRMEDQERWVNASDIYYIESVDKRTFVYCEKAVYQTEFRLYQLADTLSAAGFVRISKSCMLNINVLESIRPLMNSRMEATLSNGERVNVTRKFVSAIRTKLQEG